jgi:hypothetical protein
MFGHLANRGAEGRGDRGFESAKAPNPYADVTNVATRIINRAAEISLIARSLPASSPRADRRRAVYA